MTSVQIKHFQGTTRDADTLDAMISGIWDDVNAFLAALNANDLVDVRPDLSTSLGPYGSHVIMHYDVVVMYLTRR